MLEVCLLRLAHEEQRDGEDGQGVEARGVVRNRHHAADEAVDDPVRREPGEPLVPDAAHGLVSLHRDRHAQQAGVDREVRQTRDEAGSGRHELSDGALEADREHAGSRQRGERERPDVEQDAVDLGPAGAPLDDRRRGREHERRPRAEERRSGQRADRADRDRSTVVDLDRERLAEADEDDEGDQREDVVVGSEHEPDDARPDPDDRDEADEKGEPEREREEARPVHRVRPWMPALLRRSDLDGRRKRLEVVARFRHCDQSRLAVVGDRQRLGACVEHTVSALELRAVDGEIRLMDELVRVLAVTWVRGDADRDRRADRLARGLDVDGAIRDLAADPLGDLECLLGARLRQQDAELFASEPRRDVVVPEVRPEDLGEAFQDGIAREMAVRVVDVAQEVEVGHDQRERTVEALRAHDLLVERDPEVARVEEPGFRIDTCLGLELRHRERPVDQEHGSDRERDQPRVSVPERGHDDAEAGERELRRQAVEREQARLADRVSVPKQEHRREHRVVQPDEDDRAGEPCDGEAEAHARDQPIGMEDHPHRRPGGHGGDHVVADVEALAIPGGAVLEPGRDVLDDRDDDDQLRGQEQDRRDQEDVGCVVGLVAPRLHERRLRGGRAGHEQQEHDPNTRAVALGLEPRDERRCDEPRDDRDRYEVRGRREREPPGAARAGLRLLAEGNIGRNGAHAALTLGRPCRMFSLS